MIARALAICGDVDADELARFIAARREQEEVGPETFAAIPGAALREVKHFIAEHADMLGSDLAEGFERWRATAVDTEFLGRVGKLWAAPFDRPETLLVGDRAELVEQMVEALQHEPARSLLIVGEHGVGKTALLRAALDRVGRPLVVFEASAATINAGAMYVGQLEGRAKEVVDRLRSRNVVWVMPQLQEALYAGQHSKSPQGLLDALLPHVEAGEICMIGEVGPAEFEALIAARPRIASAFDVIRVRSLGERESIEVVHHALAGNAVVASASQDTLAEAYELAQQFLPGIAAPGNTLRLISAASAEVLEEGRDVITSVDVLTTLAATSGLPLTMLDPSMPLPLADVRAFFEERVLGQSDAVSGVVERISIARAGLNDPTRPLGVLLLVGPTGDGQDRAREGARGVHVRVGVAARARRHERVPDGQLARAPALRHERRPLGRAADRGRAQGPVLGRAARRVREGVAADLGPLPAGLRRGPPDRHARPRRRLPPLRLPAHLEHRLVDRDGHAGRLRSRAGPLPSRARRGRGAPGRSGRSS